MRAGVHLEIDDCFVAVHVRFASPAWTIVVQPFDQIHFLMKKKRQRFSHYFWNNIFGNKKYETKESTWFFSPIRFSRIFSTSKSGIFTVCLLFVVDNWEGIQMTLTTSKTWMWGEWCEANDIRRISELSFSWTLCF